MIVSSIPFFTLFTPPAIAFTPLALILAFGLIV